MKMSRNRAEELWASGVELPTHCMGPVETVRKFCAEGSPITLEGCGAFQDESPWVFEQVCIEPQWEIYQFSKDHLLAGRWYAGPRLNDWLGFHPTLTWKTKLRAETYLQLLQEDWWDESDPIVRVFPSDWEGYYPDEFEEARPTIPLHLYPEPQWGDLLS